ncbi:MAG: carboxypeptidase regulatory-like domain-containing protein [Planctomycetes bacterium]|nr:carboxypeptidase regulatory-like domain-containing protein [Planctomycetota bacterium]
MSAAPTRPFWRNWVVVVPLGTLAVAGFALLIHEPRAPRTIPVELTPPAQAELAEIPLPARVRSVEGRVVDREGAPQAGALVWLLSGDEPRWTSTRADGFFRLDGLQRGPWDVRVLAEGHRPFALVLRDGAGENVLRLSDAPRVAPTVPALVRARLVGTLIGSARQELAGAEVVLTPVQPPESLDAPLPRRARADATGRFAFDELVAGAYRVSVLPGWASGGTWPDLARAAGDEGSPEFVHRADGSAPLSVDLIAGSAAGVLADEDGRAVAGALVTLAPSERPDRPWPPVATDARGTFEFRGLPPGGYRLEARAGSARVARDFQVTARARIEVGRLALAELR